MTIVEASPIACTLAPGAYKDRLAWIAALNRDALRKYERRGLVLELSYGPEVRERLHGMVRKEQTCCAFLTFNLNEVGNEIRLTITAPETAREAADGLFEQFVANASAKSSCGCATSVIRSGDPCKGATGFKGRRHYSCDAFNWRSCLWRMLRLAICTSGNGSRKYRIFVGMVCQNACVGDYPCRLLRWWAHGGGSRGRRAERNRRPAISTLFMMATATALLTVAVLWPLLERPIIQVLRA